MGDEAAADTEPADPALQPPPAESSDAKPADKHAKKAAKRLRNALGCATDAAIIDSFAEATMMDLSSGVINIEVGGMFIAALKVAGGAPKVEKLYLHANALLGPAFCVGFTGEDVALPALIKLNMQGTGLKDGGAAAIAAALKRQAWPALQDLNLSSCEIGDDGACSLAVSIKEGCPTLQELSLGGNDIGDVGAVALAGALFGTDELAAAAAAGGEAAEGEGGDAEAAPEEPAAEEPPAEPTGGEEGGGGEGGAEGPLGALEVVKLSDNRIGFDGLEYIHKAISAGTALANCPSLRSFDVRYQRGMPVLRSQEAIQRAAEVAAARVSVALAKLNEEEPDGALLEAAAITAEEKELREPVGGGEREQASADDANTAPQPETDEEAAERVAADLAATEAEVIASAALGDGEVTAESVEAAAEAAEKYWQAAFEKKVEAEKAAEEAAAEKLAAEEKAKADAEAAETAAREAAEAKAMEMIEEARRQEMIEKAKEEEARRQEMIEKAKEEAAAAEAEAAAAEGEGGEGEAAAEAPAAEEAAEDKPAEEEAVKEEEGAAETTEPAAEPAAASSSSVAVEGGFGQAVKLDVADIKLGRSIASGAEAEVFRGLLWGQKAAVKQLKLVSDDGAEKEASVLTSELEHETRILSKLNHPCVLTLIGYTDEPCQIVLEVLDGTIYDLTSMLYSGTAPEGVSALEGGLLGPLSDVLSACAYLHALTIPILHRDLKPPNVLHDERFRCKLCDFGTAIELRQGADLPTEWIGSQLYVAPEIDKGEPYGLLADVFSFGAMAYELYHMLSTGVNFYGEGDMFEGGGMFEGLEVLRAPLTSDPPEQPARPDACDNDAMWELLMSTVAADAAERPSFAKVAREVGEIRQAAGSLAEWL